MIFRSYLAALALSFAVTAAAGASTIDELRAAIADDRTRIDQDRADVERLKGKVFEDKMSLHHGGGTQDRNRLADAHTKLDRDKAMLHAHKKALKQAKKAQQPAD